MMWEDDREIEEMYQVGGEEYSEMDMQELVREASDVFEQLIIGDLNLESAARQLKVGRDELESWLDWDEQEYTAADADELGYAWVEGMR